MIRKNMRILFAGALLCSLSLAGCDALDTKEDLNLTDEMMATRRYQMFDWGYRVYEHIPLRVHGDRRQPLRSRFRRGAIRDHVQFHAAVQRRQLERLLQPRRLLYELLQRHLCGARLPR